MSRIAENIRNSVTHPRCYLRSRTGWFLENMAHGRNTQMEAGATEYLGDLDLAHTGTQYLETLDSVAHEFGEAMYGFAKLQKRVGTLFVDTLQPGADGGVGDEKRLRRLS